MGGGLMVAFFNWILSVSQQIPWISLILLEISLNTKAVKLALSFEYVQ